MGATIVDLGKTIESQLIEADDTISQWEARCSALSDHLEEMNEGTSDNLQIIDQLEQQLVEKDKQERSTDNQINEKQVALDERDEQVSSLNDELIKTREQSEKVVLQGQENAQQLEATVVDLERTIESQHVEARESISYWETCCNTLTGQLEEMEIEVSDKLRTIEQMEENLVKKEEYVKQAQQMQEIQDERDEQVSSLNYELLETREQSEKVVLQWQESSQQLKATVTDLEKNIESQNDEADIAISQWETRCSTFSSQLEETEQGLNDKLQKIEQLEQQLMEKDCKLSTANAETSVNDMKLQIECESQESAYKLKIVNEGKESINDSYNKLTIEADEMKITIKKLETETQEVNIVIECERQESAHKLKLLNETKEKIKCSYGKLKTEAHEMRIIIGKLENEAQEVNNVMHTHLTDEVSARASEISNNALYLQLQDMKAKQITDQKIIDREQNMRALADEEIECLKSDLVLICKVEHEDDVNGLVMKFTSKAAEDVVRKERAEIKCTHSTLDRVMQGLISCK